MDKNKMCTDWGWGIIRDGDRLRFGIPKPFWLSIKHKNKCLFSRRNGYVGKIILGYSIRLRLFGRDII